MASSEGAAAATAGEQGGDGTARDAGQPSDSAASTPAVANSTSPLNEASMPVGRSSPTGGADFGAGRTRRPLER